MIICDEAHRTTGVTLSNDDSSAFVKVHDNDFIKAKKRLYMTASPRLYSDDTKAQAEAVLCSMDDPALNRTNLFSENMPHTIVFKCFLQIFVVVIYEN